MRYGRAGRDAGDLPGHERPHQTVHPRNGLGGGPEPGRLLRRPVAGVGASGDGTRQRALFKSVLEGHFPSGGGGASFTSGDARAFGSPGVKPVATEAVLASGMRLRLPGDCIFGGGCRVLKRKTQASNPWIAERPNMGLPNGVSRNVALLVDREGQRIHDRLIKEIEDPIWLPNNACKFDS